HPHRVHFRLLGSQRTPCRLSMKPQHPRLRIPGTESEAHCLSPQAPCYPKLRDFLQKVIMDIEEERQAGRKMIEFKTSPKGRIDIGDVVSQSKRHFLCRGRACFTDMVAADRDRIPTR